MGPRAGPPPAPPRIFRLRRGVAGPSGERPSSDRGKVAFPVAGSFGKSHPRARSTNHIRRAGGPDEKFALTAGDGMYASQQLAPHDWLEWREYRRARRQAVLSASA